MCANWTIRLIVSIKLKKMDIHKECQVENYFPIILSEELTTVIMKVKSRPNAHRKYRSDGHGLICAASGISTT